MNDSNGSNQMKTVVDLKDVVTDNKRKYWYYVISATVGAPGFSESEKYESIHFNCFEDCFSIVLKIVLEIMLLFNHIQNFMN